MSLSFSISDTDTLVLRTILADPSKIARRIAQEHGIPVSTVNGSLWKLRKLGFIAPKERGEFFRVVTDQGKAFLNPVCSMRQAIQHIQAAASTFQTCK
jgi:predicted transcriptional regulator